MIVPIRWRVFIEKFKVQYDSELIADYVRVYQDEEAIETCYTTYEFEEYLPNYIPIADDSGGQLAVISMNEEDTGVYLTSCGTLIADDLELLAISLADWMEKEFSFDPIGSATVIDDSVMGLYILDMGPNKMKMVSLLKSHFAVSGSEALALYKQEKLVFSKASNYWLEKEAEKLRLLGATVSIEPLK